MYGKELIIDLYKCDVSKFNRQDIGEFFKQLCELIDMQREDLHFWDYKDVRPEHIPYDDPHLVGTSAVQFIKTSDIVIHTLDMVGECYINLFSCKDYGSAEAVNFIVRYFGAKQHEYQTVKRGRLTQCQTNIEEDDCVRCVKHLRCSGPRWFRQPCSGFKEK